MNKEQRIKSNYLGKINVFEKQNIFVFSLLSFLFCLNSCEVYNFTGNSLNHAALVNAKLSQEFSIALQNIFLQRSGLKGTTENPDVLIEGEITDYSISPTTISTPVTTDGGNIQAAQNKLTITVKVHYENSKFPEASFDRTYSDEAVVSSDLDINAIETSQVKLVNERIINKIFNDIVANW